MLRQREIIGSELSTAIILQFCSFLRFLRMQMVAVPSEQPRSYSRELFCAYWAVRLPMVLMMVE